VNGPALDCRDERRRNDVRRADLNGLDYLEVADDGRTLTVFFLGKAPRRIDRGNLRVAGPRGARRVVVDDVVVHRNPAPDVDDCIDVRLAAPGDFSTYTLRVVQADRLGRPTARTLPGFDPRYDHLTFSFRAGCRGDLDCKPESACTPAHPPEPEIDYLAKDYASFRRLALDRLALVLPDWTERHVPDLGIALIELLAYVGDQLSYRQDAVATEAYLATARQRISVRRHARLVDYAMHEGCNSRAFVFLETAADQSVDLRRMSLLAMRHATPGLSTTLRPEELAALPFGAYEVFEPVLLPRNGSGSTVELRAAHNAISFYTWGDRDCCLPAGTTSATLADAWVVPGRQRELALAAGDVLIFEEIAGPRTGNPDDADPTHRHAVRLTHVETGEDRLYATPVVQIRWAAADSLPFPLCLSAVGPPPDCAPLTDISVARGNIILVDHGQTVTGEALGGVQTTPVSQRCDGEGRPADTTAAARPFTAILRQRPLTFSQAPTTAVSASGLLRQDPRRAAAQIELGQRDTNAPGREQRWTAVADLLDSGPLDRVFVTEIDNLGRAHLRFGNGQFGRQPEAGTEFTADYRVGNGPAGNVGAEAVSRIVLADGGNVAIRPRNPLPAIGGTDQEPIDEVRALAPAAFRTQLRRAVTPDDYATLAAGIDVDRPPRIQRAAATLSWTGSWYEVLTAIDPLGAVDADDELLREIARRLRPYRRIGHDLVVVPARYVPLYLRLRVCVRPGYVRGQVKAAVLDTLSNRELPGGRRGFFHPDNLSFGDPVAVSQLAAAAQAVPGVESVDVTALQRLFDGPRGELDAGVLLLRPTEAARVDNDPGHPDNGQIVLELGGGR